MFSQHLSAIICIYQLSKCKRVSEDKASEYAGFPAEPGVFPEGIPDSAWLNAGSQSIGLCRARFLPDTAGMQLEVTESPPLPWRKGLTPLTCVALKSAPLKTRACIPLFQAAKPALPSSDSLSPWPRLELGQWKAVGARSELDWSCTPPVPGRVRNRLAG